MEDKKNHGGPAFPSRQPQLVIPVDLRTDPRIKSMCVDMNGMSLRDYFAGQAIVGMCITGFVTNDSYRAYQIADAMIEERSK